jgi:hypothetical protein
MQTIQPWRKLPPAPPAEDRFVRISFHNTITLHPFPAKINRISRLFSFFFVFDDRNGKRKAEKNEAKTDVASGRTGSLENREEKENRLYFRVTR